MHVLIPASVEGNDDSTMGCDYALIEIDIERIQKYIELLAHLCYDHEDLTEMVFWGNAEFITDSEADPVFALSDVTEPVRVEIPEDIGVESERTEYDEMHITPSGVRWSCTPKHTDVRVSTSTVSLEELKKLEKRE